MHSLKTFVICSFPQTGSYGSHSCFLTGSLSCYLPYSLNCFQTDSYSCSLTGSLNYSVNCSATGFYSCSLIRFLSYSVNMTSSNPPINFITTIIVTCFSISIQKLCIVLIKNIKSVKKGIAFFDQIYYNSFQ